MATRHLGELVMVEIRFEPLSYILLHGLPVLARRAWEETRYSTNHNDLPHQPDWEAYQRMENNDYLRLVAMREDDMLIGYASLTVDSEPHQAGLILATYRDLYVLPEKRGHTAKFLRFIENHLYNLGVHEVRAGEQVGGNVSPEAFYKALGFELKEKVFGKTLKRGMDVQAQSYH
jgi:GNAT superfamily N-acetyltransferase